MARELLAIINQLPPDAVEFTCLPAAWHNHSGKIVPGLKAKVKAARKAVCTPVVICLIMARAVSLTRFLMNKISNEPLAPVAITALWAMPVFYL